MRATSRYLAPAFAAGLVGLALAQEAEAAPIYQATNLGTRQVYGLTSSGQVLQMRVGTSSSNWYTAPTLYNAYGPDAGLKKPLAMDEGWAISPNGTVAGLVRQNSDRASGARGAASDPGATPGPFAAEFPGAVEANMSFTTSIGGVNDSGQTAGSSYTVARPEDGGVNGPYGARHAILSSAGEIKDLGTLGGETSWALGVNASGQVVGTSQVASGAVHAFLYSGGTMTDLGVQPGLLSSKAVAINDAGVVVGNSDDQTQTRSFIYRDGAMTDLGSVSGFPSTMAAAINNAGEVVGMLWGSGTLRPGEWAGSAFLWRDGVMTDLNDLIPASSDFHLESAYFINDAGQIIARGLDARGVWMNYLLTPDGMPSPVAPTLSGDEVPEPSTLTFFALAAAAASRRAWRRRPAGSAGAPPEGAG